MKLGNIARLLAAGVCLVLFNGCSCSPQANSAVEVDADSSTSDGSSAGPSDNDDSSQPKKSGEQPVKMQ